MLYLLYIKQFKVQKVNFKILNGIIRLKIHYVHVCLSVNIASVTLTFAIQEIMSDQNRYVKFKASIRKCQILTARVNLLATIRFVSVCVLCRSRCFVHTLNLQKNKEMQYYYQRDNYLSENTCSLYTREQSFRQPCQQWRFFFLPQSQSTYYTKPLSLMYFFNCKRF